VVGIAIWAASYKRQTQYSRSRNLLKLLIWGIRPDEFSLTAPETLSLFKNEFHNDLLAAKNLRK